MRTQSPTSTAAAQFLAALAPRAVRAYPAAMPLEPPDPLTIADKYRAILPDLNTRRDECAALVNAYPTNTAYRDAYTQASAACSAVSAAIADLDPPR